MKNPAPQESRAGAESFVFLSPVECRILTLCLQDREDRDPLSVGLLRALLSAFEGAPDHLGPAQAP